MSFGAPVAITANTTYVASYHTNVGGYAADGALFRERRRRFAAAARAAVRRQRRQRRVQLRRGIAFPTSTFNATNYWVDVVFAPSLIDTTPPVDLGDQVDDDRQLPRRTITWTTDEAGDLADRLLAPIRRS